MITILLSIIISAHAAKPTMIPDPYKHVWGNDEGGIAGLVRFYLDINNDKKPDLFVGPKSLLGTGGGSFHVFVKNAKDGYTYLGRLPMIRPEFTEVISPGHGGYADLKTYVRKGFAEGDVLTYAYDGSSYVLWKQTQIKNPSDVKIKPAAVNAEESGPMLTWTP